MFLNALNDFKIKKIDNGHVAAQTAVTSSTFAMDGYSSVMLIADLAAVTDNAVIQLTAQDGADSGGSDAANITDQAGNTVQTAAKTAATSSNKMVVLDVQRPQKEYVTAVLTRTTQNVVVNSIIAILYNGKAKPLAAQDASVLASAEFAAAT